MTSKEILAKSIVDGGYLKEGEFTLSSGKGSDFYVDIRSAMLDFKVMHEILAPLCDILFRSRVYLRGDLFCGVLSSGLFLTGALMQRVSTSLTDASAIYVRTVHRTHGLKKDIEGKFIDRQPVIMIDDVATTGRTFVTVADKLASSGLRAKAAVCVVDRNEGAKEYLWSRQVPLYSVLNASDLR